MELWTSATPNGWKVSIMLEELLEQGVAFSDLSIIAVDLMAGEQFSESFTAINPNQKIPALRDQETNVMESCAILLYLAERYPSSLLPASEQRWVVIQWVLWQAANLGPTFGNKLSYTRYMENIPEEQKRHPLERFGSEAHRLLGILNTQLSGQNYICGDAFTLADIACYPWLRAWKWVKLDLTAYKNVQAWLTRVRARPAVERGLKVGVAEEEVDQWSQETKKRYAAGGNVIAANKPVNGNKIINSDA